MNQQIPAQEYKNYPDVWRDAVARWKSNGMAVTLHGHFQDDTHYLSELQIREGKATISVEFNTAVRKIEMEAPFMETERITFHEHCGHEYEEKAIPYVEAFLRHADNPDNLLKYKLVKAGQHALENLSFMDMEQIDHGALTDLLQAIEKITGKKVRKS